MNEQDFGRKISQHLNRGTKLIDSTRLEQLRAARERALAAYKAEPVLAHAASGYGSGRWSDYVSQHPRLLWGAVLVAAAMALWTFLQPSEQRDDASPIDAELLSSDLPIQAFAHKDFSEWLKESSSK